MLELQSGPDHLPQEAIVGTMNGNGRNWDQKSVSLEMEEMMNQIIASLYIWPCAALIQPALSFVFRTQLSDGHCYLYHEMLLNTLFQARVPFGPQLSPQFKAELSQTFDLPNLFAQTEPRRPDYCGLARSVCSWALPWSMIVTAFEKQ